MLLRFSLPFHTTLIQVIPSKLKKLVYASLLLSKNKLEKI